MNKIKNVLITGGLGGIGFDISKYFILKNYNLIIIDNQPNNKFNKILYNNSIMHNKTKIFYKKVDLTKSIQMHISPSYISIEKIVRQDIFNYQ